MEFAWQLQHYRGLPLTWRKLHNIYLSLTKLEVLTVSYRYFVFSLMTHKSKMKRTRIRNLQKRPSRLGQQDTYVYCVSGGCWKRILISWNGFKSTFEFKKPNGTKSAVLFLVICFFLYARKVVFFLIWDFTLTLAKKLRFWIGLNSLYIYYFLQVWYLITLKNCFFPLAVRKTGVGFYTAPVLS